MKLDKSIRIKQDGINRIEAAYKNTIHFSKTSKEHSEAIAKAIDSLPAKTPQWVKQFLRGYHEAKYNAMCQEHHRFMYVFNGKHYGTDRKQPDYYEKHGITPCELNMNHGESGFYWKGNLKPFFSEKRK